LCPPDLGIANNVEKMLKNQLANAAGSAIFSPLWAIAPGLKRPKFRLRVKAGGHNNTQLNPVFRGMVRTLIGAGCQQKETSDQYRH
jgi:hypothetical protein